MGVRSSLIAALCLFSATGMVFAQVDTTAPSKPQADKQVHRGEGTIQRIDLRAGKINLTHGPIPSLQWPGMTMDFVVADRAELAALKPGQRVSFTVKQLGNQYVIADIRPLPANP